MSSTDDLVAQPLNGGASFNYVLLIELFVCGVLAIFFLGYFDRLMATLVSYMIRAYTWRNFHAYIDIQSLQLSLLGGRIFFKDIRYHAHNETIIVHSGYITWNYWYLKTRDAEIYEEPKSDRHNSSLDGAESRSRSPSPGRQESGGAKKSKAHLPCRINVKVEGVQAFLYNRSPIYDAIVEHFEKTTQPPESAGSVHDTKGLGKTTSSESSNGGFHPLGKLEHRFKLSKLSDKSEKDVDRSDDEKPAASKPVSHSKPKIPNFLRLFPIRVRCKVAAAVLGNENTKAIITAKIDGADGVFDAGRVGPLDSFKLLFNFGVDNLNLKMKPNVDYKELQLTMAAGLKSGVEGEQVQAQARSKKTKEAKKREERRGLLGRMFGAKASLSSVHAMSFDAKGNVGHLPIPNPMPGQERWQGLARYLEEDMTNEHDEWDPIEYGLYSTIAEVPKLDFSFYWDIAGTVPDSDMETIEPSDDVNGSEPPAYGMDLLIYGGSVNYGPWADRQRINFQNIFFPASFADAIPTNKLLPGETRICTVFKLYLSVEEEVTLRIPVREASKDWKWRGKAESFATGKNTNAPHVEKGKSKGKRMPFWRSRDKGATGPTVRPFAWLDVTVKPNSTVNYVADMYARPEGYRAKVNADVSGLEIATSVNHGLLWRSGRTTLDADVSVPCAWNTLRTWRFNIVNENLDLFILRDHLFLMTDVITDWTAGPLAEYFTFTPFKYLLDVTFRNFKLYLNTNSSNIIDEPVDFEKNQFIILYGGDLHADVIIPLDQFRPVRNEVFFDVFAKDLGLQLCLSPANTVAHFLGHEKVATLDNVSLKGSHAFFSESSPQLTDRLTFRIHGSDLDLYMFGFVVDRLVTLKENYFGEDLHFRTLEEFQDLSRGKDPGAETDAKAQQTNGANDLDVILIISAEKIKGYLPSNMYNADESIGVDCPYASADLRLNNYYMDLEVDFSPLTVGHTTPVQTEEKKKIMSSQTEIFIASARLAGHRAFGLPPTEPDYVCLWDVDVGEITGDCSNDFVKQLARAGGCFAATLSDNENAMALIPPTVIHDIQFLKLRTSEVKIWLHVDPDALLISTGPAVVDLNDWAGIPFSQRIKVLVPDLTIAMVDAQSGSRHRTRAGEREPVKTHAYLQTTVSLNVLIRKLHYTEERETQQRHLIESDSRTHRTPFLVHKVNGSPSIRTAATRRHLDPPAMILPPIPEPLVGDGDNGLSDLVSRGPLNRQASKESFFTSSSSLPGRPRLSRQSSQASLSASVRRRPRPRSPGRFFSAVQSVGEDSPESSSPYQMRPEEERSRRGLPPSTVTFSSSLAKPYFPLDAVDPDASDLPMPRSVPQERRKSTLPSFNDVDKLEFDEGAVHTSLIISAENGIRCFLKPEAISAVTRLVGMVLPTSPADILDMLQIQLMAGILGLEKRKKGAGDVIEVSVHVPFIGLRVLNEFTQSEIGPPKGIDQYDVDIMRVALSLRSTKPPVARREDIVDTTLVHSTVGSLVVSVKEKPARGMKESLGFRATIDDLLLWLSIGSKNSVHASFRRFDIDTASNQMSLLAAIIHRSFMLANDAVKTFSLALMDFSERQRYVVYCLTLAGSDIGDPSFLNRTGIALRVAPSHLRNHDSWKIISRLRYIWENISETDRQKLYDECTEREWLYPSNAQSIVMSSWDQWRTWDLAHVRKSYIMRMLYGTTEVDSEILRKEATRSEVQLRSGTIRVTIDPGPHQTQLAIKALTINFELSPPLAPSGLMLVHTTEDHPRESVILQASASSLILRVHWAITDLVEHALRFVESDLELLLPKSGQTTPTKNKPLPPAVEKAWHVFQVVLAVDELGVALDTNNVKLMAASQAFRMSLAGADKHATKEGSYITALLHASQSYVDLRSYHHHLVHMGADNPSLFISRDSRGSASKVSEELRFAGTTSNVVVETREELLEIIQTVDMVVRDEVRTGIEKFSPFMPQASPKPSKAGPAIPTSLPKITIALIMDAYRFDVMILPQLKYAMSGKMGRLSVSPTFEGLFSLDVNLDLGEHSHDLISGEYDGSHTISVLKMPPINGKVKIKRTKDRLDLNVTTIIETIVFEAHAVHGLLSTFNRTEVSSTLKAIAGDIEALQHDIQQVLPRPATPATPLTPVSTEQTITYSAALTLAGIEIRADAPGKLKDSGTAKLLIAFHCLTMSIFNVNADTDEMLPVPEIHAQIREFLIDLLITDSRGHNRRSGNLSLSAAVHCSLRKSRKGKTKRNYRAQVSGITVNVYAETASAVIDVLNHLQDRIKEIDFERERKYLRRLRQPTRRASVVLQESMYSDMSMTPSGLLASYISVSIEDIQVAWIVGGSVPAFSNYKPEDLVLSIRLIDLSTKSENSSSLKIQDLQIQLVPAKQDRRIRSINSALMPQVIFNVGYASTEDERKLVFQATGESLDVLLDSKFMLPVNMLQRSIELAVEKFQEVSSSWQMTPTATGVERKKILGDKRLSSLLVDAEFAGAILRLQGRGREKTTRYTKVSGEAEHGGRYNQSQGEENAEGAKIETPGLAVKVQYKDTGHDSTLNAEVKVSGSSNTLVPTVVPLIMDISNSVKMIVAQNEVAKPSITKQAAASASIIDEGLLTADPRELLGGTSFNLGFRICRQEFSLSCQPIARVAASAHLNDIYITANTVKSTENDHFIAVSAQVDQLQLSIQHIYSRESTFNFAMQSITLSIMNSKHLSGTAGLSAILKVSPMKTQINARQLQDFLLFREIWLPAEIRATAGPANAAPAPAAGSQDYFVARYQQVANTAAFPWTATVQIEEMRVEIDMGQSIGKASLFIDNLWASSRKDSDWEQNLCVGISKVGIDCTGRTSGFVDLAGFKVRTMIAWPQVEQGHRKTPSIQASAGFERLRVKAAFDYQAFAIADITAFDFIMYNIRPENPREKDRLVAMLEGDKVHVFVTANTAAQSVALYQAFEKLIQDTESAYHNSLKDIEKFLRRQSAIPPAARLGSAAARSPEKKIDEETTNAPISLYTDVVVTLNNIQIGAFPSAFFDSQIFLIEASEVQARFAAMVEKGKIRTGLGMTLGQLQVALTQVQHPTGPQTLQEINPDEVVKTVASSRGGVILRVPKVVASMQTWQDPGNMLVEYIFKSLFEGKVDVGWNVGRISFIRNMYNTHARNLANRLGKPLPESAVKITTERPPSSSGKEDDAEGKEKITAVVNVPQSKYTYLPLEPPIIETPQLRDMGEATPPLEWIGLHRDRLPNVTHQIVIVALMGVAKEVEDAYGKILGNS